MRHLIMAAGLATAAAALAMRKPYRFTNKVVLITGGSRGLGLVMARQLLAERARVVICARDHDELERAVVDLKNHGPHVMAVQCDITQPDQIREMIHIIRETWSPVDVLINNAAIIQVAPYGEMTDDDFRENMDITFWGTFHTTRAVLPDMLRRRRGRIVNISSIGGEVPVPHLAPYVVSKHAVTGFTRTIRPELMRSGIVTTLICPGLMRTGSSFHAGFKGRHRKEHTWFTMGVSIPGISMSAECAARKVIESCRQGKAHATLSLPAKLLAYFNALAPNTFDEVLQAVNYLLPDAGGIGKQMRKGTESFSALAPSPLTIINQRAALRNNEILPSTIPLNSR